MCAGERMLIGCDEVEAVPSRLGRDDQEKRNLSSTKFNSCFKGRLCLIYHRIKWTLRYKTNVSDSPQLIVLNEITLRNCEHEGGSVIHRFEHH